MPCTRASPLLLFAAAAALTFPLAQARLAIFTKGQQNASQVSNRGGSFQTWYNSHFNGRGLWKWNNALDAYQRHFGALAGQPLKLVEVGVQSGGSIPMWRSALGAHCHFYGVDTDPTVRQFRDPMATITIGNLTSPTLWGTFFAYISQGAIDLLVDSGGHGVGQKLATLAQTFDHLTPGGMMAFEDVHGKQAKPFFDATIKFLGNQSSLGKVGSVHVYPFLLLLRRGGNSKRAPLAFTGSTANVSDFGGLWKAIPEHPGGHIVLKNPGWGSFLTEKRMSPVFKMFNDLHHLKWFDTPKGCERTKSPVCSLTVRTIPLQKVITGVHIYSNRLVVEVASTHVLLQAVRRGTAWLPPGP